MTAVASIRTATSRDLPEVGRILRRAGFSAQVDALLQLPHRRPEGAVLVAEAGGRPIGVAATISYPGSASGWIGAIGVVPSARGHGTGTALAQTAIARLRDAGARTIGLYATDQGQPIYKRLGFRLEANTIAWRGRLARQGECPGDARLRPLTEADRDAVLHLDSQATGEDRRPIYDALPSLAGIAATAHDGELTGFTVETPWGSSSPVIAADERSGIAVMRAVTATPGGGTLIVPEDNKAAAAAVREWSLGRLNSARRMVLGDPIARAATGQYSTFNLFWG